MLNKMLTTYREKLEAVELIENSHPEKYRERKTELQILIRLVIEELRRLEIKPRVKSQYYARNREKMRGEARVRYHTSKEKRRKEKLLNTLLTIAEK